MTDKEFPNGLIAKAPHPNAPDFVKAKLSIKVKDMGNWLRDKHKAGEEWVNLDLKVSKDGNYYLEVDTWKPDSQKQNDSPVDEGFDDSPPF